MSARTSTVQKKPQAVINTEQAAEKPPTPITSKRQRKPAKPSPTLDDLSHEEYRAIGPDDPCIIVRLDPATNQLSCRWYGIDDDAAALNMLNLGASMANRRLIASAQALHGVISSLTTQAQ